MMPPPLNTIVEWELLSLGLSMMLHLSAMRKYTSSATSSIIAIIMYVYHILLFVLYSLFPPLQAQCRYRATEPSAPHTERPPARACAHSVFPARAKIIHILPYLQLFLTQPIHRFLYNCLHIRVLHEQ